MKPLSKISGALVVVAMFVFIASIAAGAWFFTRDANDDSVFSESMNSGKHHYDAGDFAHAITAFQQALAMSPANPDVHLNLANAFLRTGQTDLVLTHAGEALQIEPGNPAALYLMGCALLRQGAFSNAVQYLSAAKQIDRTIRPVSFQLGRACLGENRLSEAEAELREVIESDKEHPSAHYELSQVLQREGRKEEAARELAEHRQVSGGKSGAAEDPFRFEQCKYTQIVTDSALDQPAAAGVRVQFRDQTLAAFAMDINNYIGPVALTGLERKDLLVPRKGGGLQVLRNSNSVFYPASPPLSSVVGSVKAILTGGLQKDRSSDALVFGDLGSQVLRFGTNGEVTDATPASGLRDLKAIGGAFMDIGPVSGLEWLVVASSGGRLRLFTNLSAGGSSMSSPAAFRERKLENDPLAVNGVLQVVIEEGNNTNARRVFLTRRGQPPLLLVNQPDFGLELSTNQYDWPAATSLAVGDLNHDRRSDAVLLTENAVAVYLGGLKEPRRLPARHHHLSHLCLLDYDNDGWLDIVAWGPQGIRVWRNRGRRGFHETTASLGLDAFSGQPVEHLAAADFDQDGDMDWILSMSGGGLRFLRNEGGNANDVTKLRPIGSRSNGSVPSTKLKP